MRNTVIPYNKALPEAPGRTPYSKPDVYLEKLGAGDYAVRQGRRPSSMFLVQRLRAAVDAWRDAGYPGVSDVTRRLFHYWFEEEHLLADGTVWRYWWAQREAIETLAYLVEVRRFDDFAPLAAAFGEVPQHGMLPMDFAIHTTMEGQRRLTRWAPELETDAVVDLPEPGLLRYAFKIATGAGKTEVMTLAIVWSYFNRTLTRGERGDTAKVFSDNFLIIAPNVIVYERLERDFAGNKIFYERPLIPPEWRSQWQMKVIKRGDSALPDPSGNLFLVNIQQIYESREEEWTPGNAVDAILGRPPRQDLASYQPTMLERIKRLDSLLVLNDEAHHVHDDDLQWNRTLLALHDNIKARGRGGLALWLDFSATPKTQAGTFFPWIIADYPLAQAIEDQIVKAPLIVHRVDRADPEHVTKDNVVQAYHDWIAVAVERWKAHSKAYRPVGQKPVLFVMAERTAYADVIAEHIRRAARLKPEEVLVIHTDTAGNITKADLARARDAARDVDKPSSAIKVIVSVLMLREGWDVKNVSVILGLRPFTARAAILPEQAVGRGLRLMPDIGPDRRQTLEVIGTEAFELFVRQLEHEGVGIDTVSDPPPPPITIYPVLEKTQYDIALPLTKPRYIHEYRNLGQLDPLSLPPIWVADVLAEEYAIAIQMDFATTGTPVHAEIVHPERLLLSQDFLRDMANEVSRRLQLNGHFAELYSIVKRYVQARCFGMAIDLESEDMRRRLRDPYLQEGIAAFLSRQIAELATVERAIEFEDAAFRLSQTTPFTWRRQHVTCQRTIFFACATFNDLETRFAQFLDQAPDILRFAALAESYTRFRVDYLSQNGAIRFYYPDFVAVQQTAAGEVNWIIETKGREDENVAHKTASIEAWCEKISQQTGRPWRYLKVPQAQFYASPAHSFKELATEITHQEGPLFAQD